MGLLDTLGRIPKILESNITALLDKCEDPAKMIDQLLIDYKKDLVDVKRDTVKVNADLEMAKKDLDECDKEIARKAQAAQNALKAGAENDARTIIASKQRLEETRASLQQNYDVCKKNSDMMTEGYNKLVNSIEELENRRNAAKAKISLANAQKGINKASALANSSVAAESFAKYEKRAERMLAEANAEIELDNKVQSADDLTDKYAASESSTSVDDELAKMKASLGM